MQTIASWIQALGTAAIAGLTVWVIFISDAGELATELLRSELSDAKQEVKSIENERTRLEEEKKKLERRARALRHEKEDHVEQVVNARLGELWLLGVRKIGAYRAIAEGSTKLANKWKCAEELRTAGKKSDADGCKLPSVDRLPTVEDSRIEERSEWGEVLTHWSGLWECSTNSIFFGKDNRENAGHSGKDDGNNTKNVRQSWEEYQRRENEREIACFNEWEQAIRMRVESFGGEKEMSIKRLAQQLTDREEIANASDAVKRKSRQDYSERYS